MAKKKIVLISEYEKVINKLKKQGKITIVSEEATAEIERKLGEGMRKIKEDFELKEKKSRAYAAKIEATASRLI